MKVKKSPLLYKSSILLGNSLDHLDVALYSLLAPLMAKDFFPNHEPAVQIIYMYAIFSGSAFMRPVGSILFGWIAVKYTPLVSLKISLWGISLATLLIGVLPGYEKLYYLSPIILILLRGFQGIFSAGESAIAKLFIMEKLKDNLARKASYLYETSTMLGIIMGSFVSTQVAGHPNIEGIDTWRLCFICAGIVGFLTVKLRGFQNPNIKIHSLRTSDYRNIKYIIKEIIVLKKELLGSSILYGFSYSTYAIAFVFINTFVPLVTNISYETMLQWNTKLLILDMALIPILGQVLLLYSPLRIMQCSAALMAVFLPSLFFLIQESNIYYVLFFRIFIITIGIIFSLQVNFYLSKRLPKHIQYLFLGLSNSIGSSLLGRSLPAICLSIWWWSNNIWVVSLFPVLLSLLAFMFLFLRK